MLIILLGTWHRSRSPGAQLNATTDKVCGANMGADDRVYFFVDGDPGNERAESGIYTGRFGRRGGINLSNKPFSFMLRNFFRTSAKCFGSRA